MPVLLTICPRVAALRAETQEAAFDSVSTHRGQLIRNSAGRWQVAWESLLPDVWITARAEPFLTYRRDETEAAAIARRRRRERRRAKSPELSRSP
jgi:hypothetical protein